MCYSAMIEQSVKSLGVRFQARIQLDLFEELFRRRLVEPRLRIPKAMERDFLAPTAPAEERIRHLILAYRRQVGERLATERDRQRARLAAAERVLALRATRKATEERRIARTKLDWIQTKLDDLWREEPAPRDCRVFPQWYAPVVTSEGGEQVVRPMRYLLRPRRGDAAFDRRFPGLYNARRDHLTGFWREQFGARHAVVVVSSFFENVARHAHEHRALRPDEKVENLVVHFVPTPSAGAPPDLTVACLWDQWVAPDADELWSFAAVTDDPPPEVREAGHDRCVVALRAEQVSRWLTPELRRDEELLGCLTDRAPHTYRYTYPFTES
ncbi:MAG: SOS response-associated peptidase family protein [Polyangiaceae bacterium]|nr:SOS response-associated peptidase family protein [Polyangiaceae bacterium]